MEKLDVVALGELLIDFTGTGKSGQGNPLYEANPGGAPCNVLAMLKKLGVNVGFIGKVGSDFFGDLLEKSLVDCGIDTTGLVKDKEVNTTLAFVKTKDDGDREFSFYRNPGADMMLSEGDVNTKLIENCRVFHFGSLSMTDETCELATRKALAIALEKKKFISFDPNLREPLWDSLDKAKEKIGYGMSVCDMLKISDNEIQWFTGIDDFDQAVACIREKYPNIKLLMLTLGKDGSVAVTDSARASATGFIQSGTVETTGAGDTFCGCMIYNVLKAMDDGKDIEDLTEDDLRKMLTFSNAAASIVTTRKGALRVMPSPDEIEALLNR